jgi:hypothetical protein
MEWETTTSKTREQMTLYLVTDERSTANTHIVISLQTLSTICYHSQQILRIGFYIKIVILLRANSKQITMGAEAH